MLPILNQSLWRDEAFSMLLAAKNPLEIIKITALDASPPLHYIVLHYWMLLFGNNEVVSRSLSFGFQILIALIAFFIARKLIKPILPQFLIAFAVLLNPFLLQYAFEARAYSMLAFLTLLAVLLVLYKKYLWTGIVMALSIFTHNFAVFTSVAFFVYMVFFKKTKFNVKELLVVFSMPLIACLLWGSVLWSQWTKVAGGFWIKPATNSIFIHSFELFTKGDLSFLMQPMLYTISLLLVFLAFSYWVWEEKKDDIQQPLLLMCVAFIPVLITYLISALLAPIYHERYLIATAPLLIILTGYSLYKVFEKKLSLRTIIIIVVSLYMVVLVQSSEQVVSITTKPAINWGVSQVLSNAKEGDIIIPKDFLNYLEVKYYVDKSGINIPVYAYSTTGKIPFYVGGILFDPAHIITYYPTDRRIWQINSDGGYSLLK